MRLCGVVAQYVLYVVIALGFVGLEFTHQSMPLSAGSRGTSSESHTTRRRHKHRQTGMQATAFVRHSQRRRCGTFVPRGPRVLAVVSAMSSSSIAAVAAGDCAGSSHGSCSMPLDWSTSTAIDFRNTVCGAAGEGLSSTSCSLSDARSSESYSTDHARGHCRRASRHGTCRDRKRTAALGGDRPTVK